MTTEDLGDETTLEWLHDGRMVLIVTRRSHRDTVDAVVERLKQINANWPDGQPYLVAMDVSVSALTPYARKRFKELADPNTPLRGRYAIVVPKGIIGSAIALFVSREYARQDSDNTEGRVFRDRAEALAWLEELLSGKE